VSGEVLEVNQALEATPELINKDAFARVDREDQDG